MRAAGLGARLRRFFLKGRAPMQTSFIHVYRDDPIWAAVKRWFQIPQRELDRLFVVSYEIRGETVDVSDIRRHAAEVRELNPGCVLVHI